MNDSVMLRRVRSDLFLAISAMLGAVFFLSACSSLRPAMLESSDLHQGRYGHAAAALDGAIYVLGGSTPEGLDGSIEKIDARSGSVERLDHRIASRRWLTAVTRGDRMYLLGGMLDVEEYDPKEGTVQVVTSLPRPRVRPRAVVFDDQLYVIGGSARSTPLKEVDIYDFTSGVWTRGADKPTANECGLAQIGPRIYAVGGYDGRAGTTAVEVYDTRTDRWEILPPLPVRTSAHSVVAAHGLIYSFGDYHQLDRTLVYDPKTGESKMLDIPYQSARHQAAVLCRDAIWVIGGNIRGSGSHLAEVQRFPVAMLRRAPSRAITDADDMTPPLTASPQGAVTRTSPPIADDLKELIEQLAEPLEGLGSLSIKWTRSHIHSLMGPLGDGETLVELLYEKPRHTYLTHPDRAVTWASDQQGVQIRSGTRKTYYEGTWEDPSLDAMRFWAHLQIPPDLMGLVAGKVRSGFRSGTLNQRWERLPDETIDGQVHAVVRARRRAPFLKDHEASALLYFDQATGLLRRIVEETKKEAPTDDESSPADALLGTTTIRIEAEWTVNEPIPANSWPVVKMEEADTQVTNAVDVLVTRRVTEVKPELHVDKPAPDFTLKLLDGGTFTLSEHKGKVVVIDFWATWCGPCVAALPHMRALSETFAEEDVVFIGVSRDRKGQDKQVKNVLEQNAIPYPNGIDVDNIGGAYGVRAIPNVLLIDRAGIVRSRHIGFGSRSAQELERRIRECLSQESAPPEEGLH